MSLYGLIRVNGNIMIVHYIHAMYVHMFVYVHIQAKFYYIILYVNADNRLSRKENQIPFLEFFKLVYKYVKNINTIFMKLMLLLQIIGKKFKKC